MEDSEKPPSAKDFCRLFVASVMEIDEASLISNSGTSATLPPDFVAIEEPEADSWTKEEPSTSPPEAGPSAGFKASNASL